MSDGIEKRETRVKALDRLLNRFFFCIFFYFIFIFFSLSFSLFSSLLLGGRGRGRLWRTRESQISALQNDLTSLDRTPKPKDGIG